MKKWIAAIIALMITLGLAGCSFTMTEPEEIVNDFFQGLKTKNEDTLILYTENEDINMLLHSKGDEKVLNRLYESLFSNLSYKILSVKKNKEETKATVEVEVSNADFSNVLKKYQDKAYNYMQANLYSGDMTKKKLNAKCLELFTKQVEKTSNKVTKAREEAENSAASQATAESGAKTESKTGEEASAIEGLQTQTITVSLTKNDNYSWDMELTEEMMELILGGLIIPL